MNAGATLLDIPAAPRERSRPPVLLLVAATTALIMVAFALVAPALAPGSVSATVGPAYAPPSSSTPLGTDVLGRDLLTRLLHGGRPLVLVAVGATALATVFGAGVGIASALLPSAAASGVQRILDVLIVAPPILVLLLLAAAFPARDATILAAALVTLAPRQARLVRAMTLEVAASTYVEIARARGDRLVSVLWRDVLPNVVRPLSTEVGLRFSTALHLAGTAGFLGLGAGPPATNWGRMVAENITGVPVTLLPVLLPSLLLIVLAVSVNLTCSELGGYQRSVVPR